MIEKFVALSKQEAKEIIDRRGGNGTMIILFVDYDFNPERVDRKSVEKEMVYGLINAAHTIIFNDDRYVPHMQLWSVKQDPEKMVRKGSLHDVLIKPL